MRLDIEIVQKVGIITMLVGFFLIMLGFLICICCFALEEVL